MPHASQARPAAGSSGRVEFPEIFDRLKELGLVEDEEFVTGILADYVRDSQKMLLDLDAAISSRDAKTCERLAHRFKGSSLNLGADILSVSAIELEKQSRSGDLRSAAAVLGTLSADFARVTRYLVRRFGVVVPPTTGETR